ncbi:hypothetical protein CY35_18G092800 [Sphagnum magellanicum]|nr:hypothetical protein CY35_18G092800 [Sphagnum magellanicum]
MSLWENSLIDMYAKCGSMDDAWRVFMRMPSLTVVSWIAMIFGHVKCSLKPNPVNFVGVLNACASLVALSKGRRAHEQIIRSRFESNVFVRNCLTDMYVKCGRMNDAQSVFNKMPSHSVVSWIAMILGHVNNLIDLYAKCGSMKDAQRVFNKMPMHNAVSWIAMLKGYAMHGQGKEALAHFKWMCEDGVEIDSVTFIAKELLELGPTMAMGYMVLLHIYAAAGKWDLSENIQKQRKERHFRKQPDCTWIEVNNEVLHTFVRLSDQRLYAGYVPDTRFVLHHVEEEDEVFQLCHHSEKFTTAFGLLSTPLGAPLCTCKNLWVCGNCHSFTKFIAKITGRVITARDAI